MASGDQTPSEFGYVRFTRTRDFESYCRWNEEEVKAYAATLPPRPINACLFLFQSHVCILCDFPCSHFKKHVGDYVACTSCWAREGRNSKNSQGARFQKDADGNEKYELLVIWYTFLNKVLNVHLSLLQSGQSTSTSHTSLATATVTKQPRNRLLSPIFGTVTIQRLLIRSA